MSEYSKSCCTIPPIISDGYQEKGRYESVDGIKTYVTGPPTARDAILIVYDIFGFFPQTLQGADILALSDEKNPYRVFMPDFFAGKAADIGWYPPATEKQQKALESFFAGVGTPSKAIARIPSIVKAFRAANPSVENIYALGMCWGGKVVTLSSIKDSLFKAIVQVHPAMLDPADAKEVNVPTCILASRDESEQDVSSFQANLKVPHYVETFGDQIHGWMAARADLQDPNVRAKYLQGYQTVLDFLARRLKTSFQSGKSSHQVVLWSLKNSKAAAKLVEFVASVPSKAKKEGATYVVKSHAGATKPPPPGRKSKAEGSNVVTILTFRSEEDALYFVTEDPVHNEMVALFEKEIIRTPIVSIFEDLSTEFHAPSSLGAGNWTGTWE